jgi:hypothetical protein
MLIHGWITPFEELTKYEWTCKFKFLYCYYIFGRVMDIYKDLFFFLCRPHQSGFSASLILAMAILPFWTTWLCNGFRMPWWKYIESWYYIDIKEQECNEKFKKFDTW